MSEYEFVKVERDERTTLITINRPEVYNALHSPAHIEFDQVFNEFASDPDQWVAIITGAGNKAFSAGNDLKYQAAGGRRDRPPSGFAGLTERFNLNKPVIAAVNGFAMGGGLECALACDIRIAEKQAKLALPEPKVGLLPCGGGTQQLPRLVGEGWAKRMILAGEQVDAELGLKIGLVEEVVETGESYTKGIELAEQVCNQSPLSISACKALIHSARSQQNSYESEKKPFVELFDTQDQKEGVSAFLEKRPPKWRNA